MGPPPSLCARRLRTLRVCSSKGDGPLGAWLDMTALVTSASSTGTSSFASELGSAVYLDIAGWHLSLKDAKLAEPLAMELAKRKPDAAATRQLLGRVPVKIGAGRATVPLIDLLPERCVQDVESLHERFANGDLV